MQTPQYDDNNDNWNTEVWTGMSVAVHKLGITSELANTLSITSEAVHKMV